jgi:peptidoglycan/LPS O-acetylase OafA/YrhL
MEKCNTTEPQVIQNRNCQFDILRALGILMILTTHLNSYTSVLKPPRRDLLAELGLYIFIFLSGYLLVLKYRTFKTWKDVKSFIYRRLLRIYPLYLLALFLFVVMFHYYGIYHKFDMTPVIPIALAHIVGGQLLLSPMITPVSTLWFIGCIVPYYFIYIAVIKYGRNQRGIVFVAVIIFFIFAAINKCAGVIEYRFFYYYPVFIGGVLLGCNKILDKDVSWRSLILSALIMVTVIIFLQTNQFKVNIKAGRPLRNYLISEGVCGIFSFSLFLFSMAIYQMGVMRISNRLMKLITYVSMSSYAVYLFLRPVLALFTIFIGNYLSISGIFADFLLIFIGLPVLFVSGFYLQVFSDKVLTGKWK